MDTYFYLEKVYFTPHLSYLVYFTPNYETVCFIPWTFQNSLFYPWAGFNGGFATVTADLLQKRWVCYSTRGLNFFIYLFSVNFWKIIEKS